MRRRAFLPKLPCLLEARLSLAAIGRASSSKSSLAILLYLDQRTSLSWQGKRRRPSLSWKKVFDHPAEGTRDYVLEIPAPKDVTVRVVLAGTNETPSDAARIHWHPTGPSFLASCRRS